MTEYRAALDPLNLGEVFIVTSEMLAATDGSVLQAESQDGPTNTLRSTMLSLLTGTGNYLARRIRPEHGLQTCCLRPGSPARGLTFCLSDVDFDRVLRVGQEAYELIKTADTGARMLTVPSGLSFGVPPVKPGTGPTPLPSAFYDQIMVLASGQPMQHLYGTSSD